MNVKLFIGAFLQQKVSFQILSDDVLLEAYVNDAVFLMFFRLVFGSSRI